MSAKIHPRERCRSRIGGGLAMLVAMLAVSSCKGGAKECRQWRLQVEVPMGAEVTTSTRASSDPATLEKASWTTLSGPDQKPVDSAEWAERFPEVGYTIVSPDGVVSSDKPQLLTVLVADGCDR